MPTEDYKVPHVLPHLTQETETRAALLSLLEKYEQAERRRHQAWMNLVHGAIKALGGEEK